MPKCKVCKESFTRHRPLQVVCSPLCAHELSKVVRAKAEKAEDKRRREKLKSLKEWRTEAQAAFNKYIRARDSERPCISCGTYGGQRHAGHYRDTFHHQALAFEPDNCHVQCAQCNSPPPRGKGGNLINYRIGLVSLLGEARVKELEQLQPPKKYTVADLKELRNEYRRLTSDAKEP